MPTVKFPKTASNPIGYVQVTPDNIDKSKKYPLVIFLGGDGSQGDGSDRDLEKLVMGELPKELQVKAQVYSFIILAPQTSGGYSKEVNHVGKMFEIAQGLPVDFTKVYLTGISRGGEAVWGWPSWSAENAKKLAALVPVCCVPGRDIGTYCNIAITSVWVFHAKDDTVVPIGNTLKAVDQIKQCFFYKELKETYYPDGNHWIFGRPYGDDSVITWMLSKSTVSAAPLPTVEPFTVTAKVIQDDPNKPDFKLEAIEKGGLWVESKWTVLEVPQGVNKYGPIILGGGGWIRGHGRFPKIGKYKFRVEVTDAKRRTATSEVEVEYNPDGVVPVKVPRVEIDLRGKTVNGVKVYDDFTWELN
jgi:hypothetical protein